MSNVPRVTFDMRERCRRCGRKGVVRAGLCLRCLTPAILRGVKDKAAEEKK